MCVKSRSVNQSVTKKKIFNEALERELHKCQYTL